MFLAIDPMFMAHAEETSGEAIASKTPVNRISLLRREYVTRSLNGIKRNVQSKQLLGDGCTGQASEKPAQSSKKETSWLSVII